MIQTKSWTGSDLFCFSLILGPSLKFKMSGKINVTKFPKSIIFFMKVAPKTWTSEVRRREDC